jgi:class 3 adenylate cyclase
MVSGHSHQDQSWSFPPLARFLTRLAAFSRLIRYDARGSGESDRVSPQAWTFEACADDLLAVLDAAGSERAVIYGGNVMGLVAITFAAMYPERVSHLVLDGCYARFLRADDYPAGLPERYLAPALDRIADPVNLARGEVSGGLGLEQLAPSLAHDAEFRAGYERLQRASSNPALSQVTGAAFVYGDVRSMLGDIQAPTLVLCRADDRFAGPRHAHYLAEHIRDAQYVELPGRDNLTIVGDVDAVIGDVEEFLTGARHRQDLDRVLTTILFTDIVESTDRAAAMGDRRWRELLDRHDEIAHEEIEHYRGQFVKSTGDGIVAMFDGPTRAVRCAQAITKRTAALGLDVRSGLHTGEVEHRGGDLHGLAVHVAQRVCATAEAGEVLVSRTVLDLVSGSDIRFEDDGEHELKGVPGTWLLSRVTA